MLAEDTHSTLGHSPTGLGSQETKMNQATQLVRNCSFLVTFVHSFI